MKPSINERLLIRLLVVVISEGDVIRLDPEFTRLVQRSVSPIVPDDTRRDTREQDSSRPWYRQVLPTKDTWERLRDSCDSLKARLI